MKSSFNAKSSVLLALTGLVIAYVRDFLQYRGYMWESVSHFFGFWLIHAIALLLFTVFSYPAVLKLESIFFGEREDAEQRMREHVVYVSAILLLAAVAVFILANWVPVGDDFSE